MNTFGRILQVLGLIVVGFGAVGAFWTDVSEGVFMTLWLAGSAVFFLGTSLRGR